MAYALDRQHARVVRAYARLRELYENSLRERAVQRDRIGDLTIELRELRRRLDAYDSSANATMGKLLASTQYAIAHLVDAGDHDAAGKLGVWLDDVRERMVPLADVSELRGLLDEWATAARDGEDFGLLYMRTEVVLDALRRLDGR